VERKLKTDVSPT